MSKRLFIVFLRKPGRNDKRTDPFWEFGSFGCTGCHDHNLLHPKKEHVKAGDRLAFVQGGPEGCKLLLITPPVKLVRHASTNVEVRWEKHFRPFRYYSRYAPVLAEPGLKRITSVELTELGKLVNQANRSTAQAKFASCFRTCCQPLAPRAAAELTQVFTRAIKRVVTTADDFIKHYTDALPGSNRRLSLKERRCEYKNLLAKLNAARATNCCSPSTEHRCR